MIRTAFPFLLTLVSVVIGLAVLGATDMQERDRKDIPDQFKWDLTDALPERGRVAAGAEELESRLPAVRTVRGQAGRVGGASRGSARDDVVG